MILILVRCRSCQTAIIEPLTLPAKKGGEIGVTVAQPALLVPCVRCGERPMKQGFDVVARHVKGR